MRTLPALTLMLAATTLTASAGPAPVDAALVAAIASPVRSPNFVARDQARHPLEELAFFGLKPGMTVVELWPGGGYWTEILGPYLADKGQYYGALPPAAASEQDSSRRWHAWVAAQKGRLGEVHETVLGPARFDVAPPESADLVLTFRNVHNWMDGGYADDAFVAAFRALKPGGILGVEGHRGRTDQPQDPKAKNGYVREDFAIGLARRAGFELVGASEINANPKDTKDWVDGVWTLPPTLSQKDKDRDRYVAIGEADNFVLKFRKPAQH